MAISNLILPNPSGYSGYQSLLKKKPATQKPLQANVVASEEVVAQPITPTKVSSNAGLVSSGPGAYKGVQINPGTDAEIQAQIRAIDNPVSPIKDIPAPNRGLFNDVRGSVSPSVTTPVAPNFSGLVGTLAERATTPTKDMQDVLKRQLSLSNKLSDFRQETADAPERIYGAGGGAKVVQNRLQAVQAMNAAREQAMATQLGELGNVYGNLLTGQGQTLSGLGTAAGLAQPQLGAVGQVPFNPLDMGQGNILGSQGGGIQQAGALLGDLEAAKQRALTGGTTQTSTFANIYGDAQKQAAQISQQRNAINQVGNEVLNLLQTNPEMNQFALQYGNRKINQLSTQLSDPRYAALNTYIRTLQARIGTALQAGEIPTAATENASAIANGNLTLNALAATLQAVDKELGAFAQTQQDLANYAQGQFGGSSTPSGGAGGETVKVGNYTYKVVNGKYVLAQ